MHKLRGQEAKWSKSAIRFFFLLSTLRFGYFSPICESIFKYTANKFAVLDREMCLPKPIFFFF